MEFKLEYLLALLIVIVPAIDYLLQKRKGRVSQDVSRETAQAPNSAKTLSRGVFIGLAISLALFGGYYLFDSGYFDGGFYEAISEKKSSDWKTFRGNNSRTGFYSGNGVPKLNRIRWKFKTDDGVSSSPAVSDGVVYVGSDDNHLYAVNTNTGQEIWRFKTDAWIESPPAVSDGVVYVGSWDNHLYALE